MGISSFWVDDFDSVGSIPMLGKMRALSSIISQIFKNNEVGFAYDINDLSTLFQDAAGTIPVTAAGQPMGLVLDKSKGLALGAEVLTNGNFANGKTGWTDVSNWWSIVGGRAYHPYSGAYKEFKQSVASMANKFVKVSFDVQVVQGVAVIGLSATNVSPLTFGVGTHTVTMYALPSATSVFFASRYLVSTPAEFYIDNVSVKELAGNHAYQTTSASRPLLQRNATTGAYYLAFDGTDDFLVTNSIDFTATDKVSLFAGVRKLSDAASGILVELSTSSDNTSNKGSFTLGAPYAVTGYGFQTLGNGTRGGIRTNGAAPTSDVIAGRLNLGAPTLALAIQPRRNGIPEVTIFGGIDGLGGNFGNYPLYIGRRGGTSAPFNGHLYSLIGVARLTNDYETTTMEKAIAKNVGVTL